MMEKLQLPSKLIRWSGPASILGGVLWITRELGNKDFLFLWYTDWNIDPLLCIVLLSWLVWGLGYIYRNNSALCRAGFTSFFIGAGLMMFSRAAPFVLLFGLMITGIACIIKKDLGAWSILPLIMGVIGLCSYVSYLILWLYELDSIPNLANGLQLIMLICAFLFGLGWVLFGYMLWSYKGRIANTEAA